MRRALSTVATVRESGANLTLRPESLWPGRSRLQQCLGVAVVGRDYQRALNGITRRERITVLQMVLAEQYERFRLAPVRLAWPCRCCFEHLDHRAQLLQVRSRIR